MNAAQIPDPFRKRKAQFNSLKIRALAAFQDRGWIDPPTLAAITGLYPSRAAYSYAKRLWAFGLLQRRKDARGLLVYSLSPKGKQRLIWLTNNHEASQKDERK